MTKNSLLGILLLLPCLLAGQVTINVVLPPAGLVNRDQLWNLALVNNNNTTYQVTILCTLQDAVTGQTVLSAGTRAITLTKGLKMLQPRDVQPVQYNVVSAGLSSSFLPLGSYLVCYSVSHMNKDGLETLANECARINITPLSPPLLNSPADKAVVNSGYPQFTWLPPTPVEMFSRLQYNISVAEVLPGQTPAEAIQYNTPRYISARLNAPFDVYPSSYGKLEPGKNYAWQVTASDGVTFATATEVWSFTVAGDSVRKEIKIPGYIEMRSKAERAGTSFIGGKELNVKYYSYASNKAAVIRIYDKDRSVLQEQKIALIYGDNFITIKLNGRFQKGSNYQAEIVDVNNNIYSANFGLQ